MVKEFNNNWAVIVGGSSGLGLAAAHKLAKHGMNICIIHRDTRTDVERIAFDFESIKKNAGKFLSFNADAIRDVAFITDELKQHLNGDKVFCFIHSIAKGSLKPMTGERTLDKSDFTLTVDAMAINLYEWVQALKEREMFATDSRIIAFTSEGSKKPMKNYAAVSAAKAALEAISRSIALEMAPLGIKCNCIQAGVTDTKSLRMIPQSDKLLSMSEKRNPSGRLTTPEDIANVVYLLCRAEALWITGTTIIADGGESLQ